MGFLPPNTQSIRGIRNSTCRTTRHILGGCAFRGPTILSGRWVPWWPRLSALGLQTRWSRWGLRFESRTPLCYLVLSPCDLCLLDEYFLRRIKVAAKFCVKVGDWHLWACSQSILLDLFFRHTLGPDNFLMCLTSLHNIPLVRPRFRFTLANSKCGARSVLTGTKAPRPRRCISLPLS